MGESYNCLRLDNKYVFQVEVYKKENDNRKFFEIGDKIYQFESVKVGQLTKLISHEGKFKDSEILNLWKVNVDENDLNPVSTEDGIKQLGGELMKSQQKFVEYFPADYKPKDVNIHIVAVNTTTTTEFGRKRSITEEETESAKRRRIWAVNGVIHQEDRQIFYYTDPVGNDKLLKMIRNREFVALYGARASGKSTRVQRIRVPLKAEGLICIYVSLEHVKMETVEIFWTTLGSSLRRNAKINIDIKDTVFESFSDLKINSANDFNEIFEKSKWNNDFVLLIDEFDKLYDADETVRSECLETFRGIKNAEKNTFAIWSIVVVGTFSILHLKSGKTSTSTFNVNEPFQNPNFTLKQVQELYREFEDDFDFTIDPEIVMDIHKRTSGHAGLVCLCGRSICENLIQEIDKDSKLSFVIWSKYATKSIENEMYNYSTFRKMVSTLTTNDSAKHAVDLLRTMFLGFFDYVPIHDAKETRLAEFLVAEGVLMRDEKTKDQFKMSSVFVDGLIRKRVIPLLYMSRPTISVPQTDDGSLETLDTLREAICCFDKTIVDNAFNRSFKTALVRVNDHRNVKVPRESVYDAELNRILVNWIVQECGFEVTGQWHLIDHADNNEKDKHNYSDIIIVSQHQTIVLELLATATKKELDEHFERVLNNAEKLSANEMWIVHFTCENGATQNPYWPPNDRKFESVNVVHFFHDRNFKNVRMSARYASNPGTFRYIKDQVIP